MRPNEGDPSNQSRCSVWWNPCFIFTDAATQVSIGFPRKKVELSSEDSGASALGVLTCSSCVKDPCLSGAFFYILAETTCFVGTLRTTRMLTVFQCTEEHGYWYKGSSNHAWLLYMWPPLAKHRLKAQERL